jgi:hypothetical protein
MSQTISGPGNPYYLSNTTANDKIFFNKLSSPPLAIPNKGVLYELNDGKLYFNGGEVTPTVIGDVDGPTSSTDNAVAVFDGITGKLIKNSTTKIIGNDISLDSNGKLLQDTAHLLSNKDNLLVGDAGTNYTTETNNLLIENDGTIGDSKVIRIGNPALHEYVFIAGVKNVFLAYDTPSYPVVVDDNFLLGFSNALNLNKLYIDDLLCIHRSGDTIAWNAFFFAGNETISGGDNCGFGRDCLKVHTSGYSNTAIGSNAMASSLTCGNSVAIGAYALYNSTNCTDSVAIGSAAMTGRTTGVNNVSIGRAAGYATTPLASGEKNTIVGSIAGTNYIGDGCVYLGHNQGTSVTGSRNIRIHGDMHGFASSGNDNIFIGSIGDTGNLTETATIRLGTQGTQNKAIIAGIYDNLLSVTGSRPVRIDANGQLTTTPINERGVMGQIAYENVALTVIPLVVNVPSEINPATTVTNVYGTATPGNGRLSYTLTESRSCKVSFSASLRLSAGANQTCLVKLYKNGIAEPNSGMKILLANTTDFQTVSFNRIVSFNASDYVSMFITNESGSNNVSIYSMSIVLTGNS